jgi:hypothetical protein
VLCEAIIIQHEISDKYEVLKKKGGKQNHIHRQITAGVVSLIFGSKT